MTKIISILRLTHQKNPLCSYKKHEVATEFLVNYSMYVLTWHCLNNQIKLQTDWIEYKVQNINIKYKYVVLKAFT